MELEEALKDTGIAESWYDGYTAVVARSGAHCTLSIRHERHDPHYVREGLTVEQVKQEMRSIFPSHPMQWNAVELEG